MRGNPNLALLTPQSFYYPYVTNGFVVIGSQYRGADGGEGKDEFGGADVNDVLNLMSMNRLERERLIVEWFRRYMK